MRFARLPLLMLLLFLLMSPIYDAIAQGDSYPVITVDNVSGLEQIGLMSGDQGWIDISPDGQWLAVAGLDGVWIFDLDTGDKSAFLLRGHIDKVNAIRFHPIDHHLLTSVGDDGTLRIWDVQERANLLTVDVQTTPIFDVDIDRSGRFIAIAGGASIQLFLADTGEQVRVFTDVADGVRRVEFLNQSSLLLGATFNATIGIWNLNEDGFIGAISNSLNGDIRAIATSADGTQLAVALQSGRIVLNTIASGEQRILEYHTGGVQDVAYSPNGRLLASVGIDKQVLLMDATTGELLSQFEREDFTYSVAFSSDSQSVYVASADGKISTWDIEQEQIIVERELLLPGIRHIVYSPDGRFIAGVTHDGRGRVFNAQNKRQVAVFDNPNGRILTIAYRPDGRLIATAGDGGEIQIWRTDNFELGDSLNTIEDQIYSLAFSPDPNVLVVGGEDTIRLWNLPDKENIITLEHEGRMTNLSVSPDGSLIATAGGLWNVFDRAKVDVSVGEFTAVAISPDSDFLVTNDRFIPIVPNRVRPAREGYVGINGSHIAFHPDGGIVAIADGKMIKLAEVATQTIIASIDGHTAEVSSLAFSPDGTQLVSGSLDGTIRQWAVANSVEDDTPPSIREGLVLDNTTDELTQPTVSELTITNENFTQLEPTIVRQAIRDVIDFDVAPDGSSVVLATLNGVFYLNLLDSSVPPIAMPPTNEQIFSSGLAVDYAQDGTQVVVSHGFARSQEAIGGGITVWDVTGITPQLLNEYVIEEDRGFSVALNPAKTLIAVGYDRPNAEILDIASGEFITETQSPLFSRVIGLSFNQDSSLITLADASGNKAFFDVQSGELVSGFNSGIALPMWWSTDNRYLYSAELSGFVLRDGISSEPLQEHPYPTDIQGDIRATDVTNGQLIITSEDNIWFLDYQTGDNTQTITDFNSIITHAEVTLDGNQIVVVTNDNHLRIWDIESGEQIKEIELGLVDIDIITAISDDGRFAVFGHDDNLQIISTETGEFIRSLDTQVAKSLRFLPNSTILVVSGEQGTLEIWDVSIGLRLSTLETSDHDILEVSDDGNYAVTHRDNTYLTLHNIRTGDIIIDDKQVHLNQFNDADISLNENLMATVGDDGVIKLWDLDSREQDALILTNTDRLYQVEFSPTDTRVAVLGDDGVYVYDYRFVSNINQEYTFNLTVDDPHALYFSVDGSLLFAHISDTLHIWTLTDGRKVDTITLLDGKSILTANGETLIAIDNIGNIQRWEIQVND